MAGKSVRNPSRVRTMMPPMFIKALTQGVFLKLLCSAIAVLAIGGCSKRANPEVCCVDPADCASIGADEDVRSCPTALTCVDHECVIPECSTQGCSATEPVCNLATNACEACTGNQDCTKFRDQGVCDVDSGGCVQCLVSSDCGPTVPVCENQTCRGCELDSECASGACGTDGMCVSDSSIVYIDPLGTDTGDCPRSAPCRSLNFALSRTTASRSHIVMAKAGYSLPTAFVVSASSTPAQRLFLHGGDASLMGVSGDSMVIAQIPITIRNLELQQTEGGGGSINLLSADGTSYLERVRIRHGSSGVAIYGPATLRDLVVEGTTGAGTGTGIGLGFGAVVDMDRVEVRNWAVCVEAFTMSPQLIARNVVASNCTTRAFDLASAQGLIEFTTIVTEGNGSGVGPRGVFCANAGTTFRSSIIWTMGSQMPLQGCNLVSSIVGPTADAGASNADPRFVNRAGGDFRIMTGSPAIDGADMGPSTDVRGNPRPVGLRYDLGAYEGQ